MIEHIIEQRRKDLGGFEVGRVLPYAPRRMVGPFVFFDRMGPAQFPQGLPRTTDVRPHPHIGLATITYLFQGEVMHRDSVGSEQAILPGEVNWMTAGSGITHSERFEHARQFGGPMDGIQTWVALPDADEETDPSFAHFDAGALPEFGEPGSYGRLIAGAAFGVTAPARTYSPLFYLHWELGTGRTVELPDYPERAFFVARGAVEVEGQRVDEGKMVVFGSGPASATALEPARLMLLGGEPVGPRFIEWNFVSSSQERIEQAKADWRAGRIKLPDLDNQEFIPLPEPSPPANPMS